MEICALIMAGGEGKRFWPLSSKERPKQFLSLIGERSMIRQTVDRILPLIPIANVFVVTVKRYAEETLKHIPELPEENLILEPEGKNTAPCIAYGTLRIMSKFEDAVTVVLPADHAIGDDESFRDVLRFAAGAAAVELARENADSGAAGPGGKARSTHWSLRGSRSASPGSIFPRRSSIGGSPWPKRSAAGWTIHRGTTAPWTGSRCAPGICGR